MDLNSSTDKLTSSMPSPLIHSYESLVFAFISIVNAFVAFASTIALSRQSWSVRDHDFRYIYIFFFWIFYLPSSSLLNWNPIQSFDTHQALKSLGLLWALVIGLSLVRAIAMLVILKSNSSIVSQFCEGATVTLLNTLSAPSVASREAIPSAFKGFDASQFRFQETFSFLSQFLEDEMD